MDSQPEKSTQPVKTIEEAVASLVIPHVTEISAKNCRAENKFSKENFPLPKITCVYMPVWDAEQEALNSYLCIPYSKEHENNQLMAHQKRIKNQNTQESVAIDLRVLECAAEELSQMVQKNQNIIMVCPVQHETLYRFDTYEAYKERLLNIPLEQRRRLILMVMNSEDTISQKDKFWFAPALKGLVSKIYIDVPLRNDIKFGIIFAAGVDAVGVTLDLPIASEQNTLNQLKAFGARAKSFKIPKAFILNVSTLSITTSSVCSGFDFLGGAAIHADVDHPDTLYKFRHEDLLKGLRLPQA